LTAWDASTGAKLWTDTVIPPSSTAPSGCDAEDRASDLEGVSVTRDGQWGVFSWYGASDAIDLASGKMYPNKGLAGVLGNYVVTDTGQNNAEDGPATFTLTVPGPWSSLGSSSDPEIHIVDAGDQAPAGTVNATGPAPGQSHHGMELSPH